jgi:hypothetical protein
MLNTPIRSASALSILLLASAVASAAQPAAGQGGALGSTWADVARMPDLFNGTWGGFGGGGFVESDARLNVPFTAKAQKYVDAYKQKRDIPYAQEGCTPSGLPIAMRMGRSKFSYAPGLITIYMQTTGNTRFIRMNQTQGRTSPKYYGNSVGHWEGDTLVVETVDFLPEITFQYGVGKPLPPLETVGTANLGPPPLDRLASLSAAIWGPHGEGMYMVERMRLVDPNTMEIKTTVYDDTVWTKPYEMATRSYRRSMNSDPEEWVCSISITSFDPDTNTYYDKDPEEMVRLLDRQGR